MSAEETAHLRRRYPSYLITDERAKELLRTGSIDEAESVCLERARAGRGERFLIFGETSHDPHTRRAILLCRWIPPWFPAAQPRRRDSE